MTETESKITQQQKIIGSIIIFFMVIVIIFVIRHAVTPKMIIAQIEIESSTSWSGSIGSDKEGFWTVEGEGCEIYNVEGTIISCAIQKQTTNGYLRVSIIKNGDVVKTQQTTAEYGVVSITD